MVTAQLFKIIATTQCAIKFIENKLDFIYNVNDNEEFRSALDITIFLYSTTEL